MIRNVVVGRLREGADEALLTEGLDAIAALRFPGLLAMQIGRDLGLRPGGWSFAITNDWADADAYRVYDLDPEHERIRAEHFVVSCEQIARVQYEL